MDFDNIIHIIAFMKTIGYREPKITFLKCQKNDKYDYISNNNLIYWAYFGLFWPFFGPTVDFDNIVPISACITIIGLGGNLDF